MISLGISSQTQILFIHNIHLSCLIILKFCTEHGLPCSVQKIEMIRKQSYWNFAQSTAVWSPCSVKNSKWFDQWEMRCGQTWFSQIWVCDKFQKDIPCCTSPLFWMTFVNLAVTISVWYLTYIVIHLPNFCHVFILCIYICIYSWFVSHIT